MVVYVEDLFLENTISGLVFAVTVRFVSGIKTSRLRVFLSGIISGIYAFVTLLNLPQGVFVLSVPVFCFVQSAVLFGFQTFRRAAECGFIYLLISVIYGGTAIAAINVLQLPADNYTSIIAGLGASVLTLMLAINLFRSKRIDCVTNVTAEVDFGGKIWNLEGEIDTGNYLKDPISGRSVALVDRTLLEKMTAELCDMERRIATIPYCGVGASKGILIGYRSDYVRIEEKIFKNIIVAGFPENNSKEKGRKENFQILLPRDFIERGIYGNDKRDNNEDKTVPRIRNRSLLHRGK